MILTFVLGVLIALGVIFALRAVIHTREFRALQTQMIVSQGNLNRLNLLFNDAIQYGKTHPDINRVLAPYETKSTTH